MKSIAAKLVSYGKRGAWGGILLMAVLVCLPRVSAAQDGPLIFNTIWKEVVQACGGCGIWFSWQNSQANKPRLVVEYSSGGTFTNTYQHGLSGVDDGHSTYVRGETTASEREARKHELLIKMSPRRRGLLRFDLSDIPASATITKVTLYLHIHTSEGLANADVSSVLEVYRCEKDWNWDEATDTYYDAGMPWDANGGDFGAKIRDLRAKEDMKDRGFRKSNPDIWFDFTPYVQALQAERGGVPPGNQPPVAQADNVSTPADSFIVVRVLDNDTDPDLDTLSIASFTQPSQGTVTDNGDGTLTFDPDPGFAGQASFSYTVTDGNGGTDSATVTVTVAAQPDTTPPAIFLAAVVVGGTLDDLSATLTAAGAAVTVGAGGSFSHEVVAAGSPTTVTLSATDGGGNTSTRAVQFDAGPGPGPGPNPLTIEAEDMTLTVYYVEDYYISALSTGTALSLFSGATGSYRMKVVIIAENDGQPSLEVYVAQTLVGTIVYPLGASARDPQTVDLGLVNLTTGDEIKLVGTPDAGAAARVDKVILEP